MRFPASKKILLPAGLLAVGVVGAGLLYATKAKPPPLKVEEQAWTVEVQPVVLESVAPSLPLYGQVETPRTAKLAAALAAEVREVAVREGDEVRAGQALIKLDDRDSRYALASREAEVKEAEAALLAAGQTHDHDVAALQREETLLALNEKALARAQDLAEKKLAAPAAVDEARQTVERQSLAAAARRLAVQNFPALVAQAQARLTRARAERDTARLTLERTRLIAPYAGRIAKVKVAPGDRVNLGAELVDLYDTQALELRAQIPAPNVAALRQVLGKGGTVRGGGRVADQAVTVVLERLAGQVEEGGGGVDGLFRVTAGREALALGQFVDVTIELAPVANVAVVPATALYGMNRVYVMRDGRMAGVDVQVAGEGRRAGKAQVLVRSPALREGDNVIVTHLPNAIDGLRVQPAAATGQPAAAKK